MFLSDFSIKRPVATIVLIIALMGLGLLAIVVTMFFPQGLWGFVSRRYGLQLFPVGRRVCSTSSRSARSSAALP